jgi:hypothetical protein
MPVYPKSNSWEEHKYYYWPVSDLERRFRKRGHGWNTKSERQSVSCAVNNTFVCTIRIVFIDCFWNKNGKIKPLFNSRSTRSTSPNGVGTVFILMVNLTRARMRSLRHYLLRGACNPPEQRRLTSVSGVRSTNVDELPDYSWCTLPVTRDRRLPTIAERAPIKTIGKPSSRWTQPGVVADPFVHRNNAECVQCRHIGRLHCCRSGTNKNHRETIIPVNTTTQPGVVADPFVHRNDAECEQRRHIRRLRVFSVCKPDRPPPCRHSFFEGCWSCLRDTGPGLTCYTAETDGSFC